MLSRLLLVVLTFVTIAAHADNKPYSIETFLASRQPAPTVIVAHGCLGPDYWTAEWAARLASWGYNAVVVNNFSKRGYHNGICMRGRRVPPDQRNIDHIEVAAWIRQQPWHQGNIVMLGMSHGGATAMDAAAKPETAKLLAAAISMYPGCSLVKDLGKPQIPVQVHLGSKDTWTPCLDYNWTGYSEVHIYPAGHGFDITQGDGSVINGQRIVYEPKSAELSRERIREFLKTYLTPK